jgi:hypothetical protein
VAGVGDFNADGTSDLLWYGQSTGSVVDWFIKKGAYNGSANLGWADPAVWRLAGTSDFNGDRAADVLWCNQTNGTVGAWIISGGRSTSWAGLGMVGQMTAKVADANSLQHAANRQAASAVSDPASNLALLVRRDFQPAIAEVTAGANVAGADVSGIERLTHFQTSLSDLSDSYTGETKAANRVDGDGRWAGDRWSGDSTPGSDEVIVSSRSDPLLPAVDPRAVDRIDLPAVAEHQLGHVAGFDDLDDTANSLVTATR